MELAPLGIGAMARASGLSVSALRFYDSSGLLRPSAVDPATGYRRYAVDQLPRARLIAALRGTGMSLAEIREVLDVSADEQAAGALLDRQHRQLELDLVTMTGRLELARSMLGPHSGPATMVVTTGADLTAAWTAVRFAAATNPEQPGLNGVLFDYDGISLRLVATDRYRLAVATVPLADAQGPAAAVLVPPDLALPTGQDGSAGVALRLEAGRLQVGAVQQAGIAATFPDWRTRSRLGHRRARVSTSDLRHQLTAAPTRVMVRSQDDVAYDVVALTMSNGQVHVSDPYDRDAVAINRAFLIEALDATGSDEAVVAFTSPTGPVAVLSPGGSAVQTLTMPTSQS